MIDLAYTMNEDNAQLPDYMPYLEGLNEPQKEAVLATEGPVLLLAGAGTGKTRALTTRLGHLLYSHKARPFEIFAVTFTNKAAAEMRERVNALLGTSTEGWWLGTFHALAVRILRKHAELVGLKSNFTILGDDDQQRLIKQILKAETIDEKKWPPRVVQSTIDHFKNQALLPHQIGVDPKRHLVDGKIGAIYKLYQDRLKTLNACDFGDLLLHVIDIFKNSADVLESYQNRFKYILVDEYQDTNVAQYLWLRLMAQKHQNICCVGDDDQSIYGWRGAQVDNILRFEKDFPGAKTIRLEQNYRSTGHILDCASALIAQNQSRLGKTLWTSSDAGDPVQLCDYWDSPEEARAIGDEIENLQRAQVSLSQIAILVRAGFQTREFEERFITTGLPYRVIGGPRFYERMEIRDAVAYLRLVVQHSDDLAFERIINVPKRGLGTATLQQIHHLARASGKSLFDAAQDLVETDELKPKPRNTIIAFIQQVKRWTTCLETMDHVELTKVILDESGYTEMWLSDKSPDAPTRLENLKEFVSALDEFENIPGFLEHIALVMENATQSDHEMVTIMTLHAAKGLEFDYVFLPGWEEGVFPNPRAMEDSGARGLEEERRLAYVGMTRARKNLVISHTKSRRMYGRWETMLPSRFIQELSQKSLIIKGRQNMLNASSFGGGLSSSVPRQFSAPQREKYLSEPADDYVSQSVFGRGERVFHQKFGYGKVTHVEGDKVKVYFDKAGEKKVMVSFLIKAEEARLI